MKQTIKFVLQKLLGFENYLFVFSVFTIFTLKYNKKERDFLFFLSLIPNEGSLLDVGANIGVMSYHFSKKCPSAKIISFEPVPVNAKILRKVVSFFKLKNVDVKEMALGNMCGTTEIVMPVINSVQMQGLSYIPLAQVDDMPPGHTFVCKIDSLDHLAESFTSEFPLKALKIDVENMEWQVLEGAKEVIKQYKPIIYLELWDNQNRTDCLTLLSEFGYEVYTVIKKTLVKFDIEKHSTQNFIFIPNIG